MMRTLLSIWTLALTLTLPGPSLFAVEGTHQAMLKALEREIDNFGVIDDHVYRGAQPSRENFQLLKDFGIRTIVNFRHELGPIERDRVIAEGLGFRYISIPWRIQLHPKRPVMREFLDVMARPEDGPFFIHCRRGAERTGVADAIYRAYHQNLSRDEAWDKAIKGYKIHFFWRPFLKRRIADFHKNLESNQ